jgi:hypothetical protein
VFLFVFHLFSICFHPSDGEVSLQSTPSSLGCPLLQSFLRLTLVTPKTVLSKFTLIRTFNQWNHHHLIGACSFNLGQKYGGTLVFFFFFFFFFLYLRDW